MNPTDVDLNARPGLRRSLLGYFAAWIVLLVALVAAWSWIERRASEDIDTLQRASRDLHGRAFAAATSARRRAHRMERSAAARLGAGSLPRPAEPVLRTRAPEPFGARADRRRSCRTSRRCERRTGRFRTRTPTCRACAARPCECSTGRTRTPMFWPTASSGRSTRSCRRHCAGSPSCWRTRSAIASRRSSMPVFVSMPFCWPSSEGWPSLPWPGSPGFSTAGSDGRPSAPPSWLHWPLRPKRSPGSASGTVGRTARHTGRPAWTGCSASTERRDRRCTGRWPA